MKRWILLLLLLALPARATITLDAASEFATPGTGSNPTWSHSSGGTPEGVVVYCASTGSVDIYTGATYDGEAMTQIGSCADAATETIFGELYFLGTGVNTTVPANIVCTTDDTTTTKWGASFTLNANGDVQNGGSCSTTADLAANETCSIADPGGPSYTAGGTTHGANAVSGLTGAATGFTLSNTGDLGSQIAGVLYNTAQQASGAVTVGFTHSGDDGCGTYIAVEQVTPDPSNPPRVITINGD